MRKFSFSRLLLRRSLFPALLLAAASAHAQLFCVYDPLGAQGDFYSMARDYQLAAKRWNVNIDLRAYTDDDQLDQAFRNGECDMASMIGMRARQYNQFTGTIDAPSVIENYVQMRDVLSLVDSPKLAKYMVSGGYEMVGIVPIGAAYPVVNDRVINSFEHANGKRVAVMGWDKTQLQMAEYFKVTPVPVSLPEYGKSFNTGRVDLLIAPMVIYKAMELNKGIGTKGGIVRRPLFSFTMQMLSHTDKFPADFGQKSRDYMYAQTDHTLGLIRNQEASVDNRLWIYAVHSELVEWDVGMRKLLKKLVDQGNFDPHMITLMQRVRCKDKSEDPACAGGAAPEGN